MEQPVINELKKEAQVAQSTSRVPKLQTLILHKLADIMFHDNPLDNGENIQNVLHALSGDYAYKPSDTVLKDIITKHGRSLAKVFKPMPLVMLNCEAMERNIESTNHYLTFFGSKFSSYFFDLKKQQLVKLPEETNCRSVEFNSTGNYYFTKKSEGKKHFLFVWDNKSNKEVAKIPVPVADSSIVEHNNYLFIFSYDVHESDSTLEIYDMVTWKRYGSPITIPGICSTNYFFHPYQSWIGFRIIGHNLELQIFVLSYPEGKNLFSIQSGSAVFSPNGAYVAIGDGVDECWNEWVTNLKLYRVGTWQVEKEIRVVLQDYNDDKMQHLGTVSLEFDTEGNYLFLKWVTSAKGKQITKQYRWDIQKSTVTNITDDVQYYDADYRGYYFIDNRDLKHRDFGSNSSTLIMQNCSIMHVYPAADKAYLVINDLNTGKLNMLCADDYSLVKAINSFHINTHSANETYLLVEEKLKCTAVYLLNIFNYTQPSLAELLALIVLEKNKRAKESYDPVAQEVVKKSKNESINNFVQWYFFKPLYCCMCTDPLPNNELILPCGHAQIHQKCLEKWYADKHTGCPVCMINYKS